MVALFAQQSNIVEFPQKSNEWYTPARYVEAAREVFGGTIDLDPASCKEANMVVRAEKFYTKHDNGLAQEWHGNVWLNPPYGVVNGKSMIVAFTRKLFDAYRSGDVTQAVFLGPARTEATWFYPFWQHPLCFTNKRIYFYGPESKTEHFFGTVMAYLGKNEQKFIEIFSQFGTVARRVSAPKVQPVNLSLWEVS